jgi:Glucodextranase, domain B
MSPLVIPTISIERTLKFWFIVLLGIVFVGYAGYQARNLIQGPSITLLGEFGSVQRERAVTLIGTAQNVVILRLNGREIHTDEQGRFEHTLTLENGYTIMTLEAEDRYGRKTDLTRSFIYKPNS